jgi:hypothetical protein
MARQVLRKPVSVPIIDKRTAGDDWMQHDFEAVSLTVQPPSIGQPPLGEGPRPARPARMSRSAPHHQQTERRGREARVSRSTALLAMSGPPPLLPGESESEYENLLLQVLRRARPGDIVEEIWSSDIVNLTWEIWRIRRMMSKLIREAIAEILPSILSPITKADAHSEWMKALIKGWAPNRPSAIRRVEKYLASANVSFDVVNAHAFLSEIDNVERLDRLITIAEARRNAAIREIDRHRSAFAQTLRETLQHVEDAQFEEVEATAIARNNGSSENPE